MPPAAQAAAPPAPPAPAHRPARRFDPAVLALIGCGVVLVVAVGWLFATPRPTDFTGGDPALRALAERIATLENRRPTEPPALPLLEGRIASIEARPSPDLAPLQSRLEALDRRIATAESRPGPDLGALEARIGAATTTATRAETAANAASTLAGSLGERLAPLEAMPRRVTALEETQLRANALEAVDTRSRALEGRVAAMEAALTRLGQSEARAARLVAQNQLSSRLEAGQPLGPALAALGGSPPAPLARFATLAPPTEAALRLSFEDAARAGRAASEPAREGQSVVDSAIARVTGLVTVRRGEQVVWGDTVPAEIEAARRQLEAGDLAGATARLQRLPAPARAGLAGWLDQAEALLAARAALRDLVAG